MDKAKALRILKKKEVNIYILFRFPKVEDYNDLVSKNRKLTKEEFDFLKEFLK